MKLTLSNVILQIGLFFVLLSCEDISNPAISELRISLTEDFSMQADSSGTPADSAGIYATKKFDANANADFFSNRSKMTTVEIEKLSYQVKAVAAGTSDSLVEGRFEYLNPASGQFELLAEDQNRKLLPGLSVDLPLNAGVNQNIASILTSSVPEIEIRMRGKMDKLPINLIIAPQIQLKIKVKI